jgi:hypothetical protein
VLMEWDEQCPCRADALVRPASQSEACARFV